MSIATRERPILMSAPMIRAILEGRKSQTRRVIKPQPVPPRAIYSMPNGDAVVRPKLADAGGRDNGLRTVVGWDWRMTRLGVVDCLYEDKGMFSTFCPCGRAGDFLWPRETWALVRFCREPDTWMGPGETYAEEWAGPIPKSRPDGWVVVYRADGVFDGLTIEEREFAWRPSIFMPRWASRLTLEITDVRVERLQSVSETDAYAEGVIIPDHYAFASNGNQELRNEARTVFQDLWESINGKGSWERNDYVWAIAFRRVD